MLNQAAFWIETSAILAIVFLIPLYMGFIHVAVPHAMLYTGLAGVALAAGEQLQFRLTIPNVGLWDIGMWIAAIAIGGGVTYVLALILI